MGYAALFFHNLPSLYPPSFRRNESRILSHLCSFALQSQTNSIEEGSGVLSSLQFRANQNPFTVMLSPVTVASAEGMGLGGFINSMTIDASSRATTGGYCTKYVCLRD